jgi:hypothetical protein
MSRTTKHLWIALLLAGLVLAVALWPAAAGPNAAAAPTDRTLHTMTVPAAAFVPSHQLIEYLNSGDELIAYLEYSYFLAPLQFPYPVVTIKRITLHGYDNGAADIRVMPRRARPATGAGVIMGTVASSGQSTSDPRAFATTALSPRIVNTAYHGAYLSLYLPPGLDYRFYGVTIRYEA